MTARELIHFLTEEFIDLDDPVMVSWMPLADDADRLLPVTGVRSHHGRIDLEIG